MTLKARISALFIFAVLLTLVALVMSADWADAAHHHGGAVLAPGDIVEPDGHVHGHIMPMPGESLLTFTHAQMRAARRFIHNQPNYCTTPSPVSYAAQSRMMCSAWVAAGSDCYPPGAVNPCISATCKYGTCSCQWDGFRYRWRWLG